MINKLIIKLLNDNFYYILLIFGTKIVKRKK